MTAWRYEISFLVLKKKFRISACPYNIPYLLFIQNIGSNPRLIPHKQLALTIFGRGKQYTIDLMG